MEAATQETPQPWSDDDWREIDRVRFECDMTVYKFVSEVFGLQGAPLPEPPRSN